MRMLILGFLACAAFGWLKLPTPAGAPERVAIICVIGLWVLGECIESGLKAIALAHRAHKNT